MYLVPVTLFSLTDVAVEFGGTPLLQDLSWTVAGGERWGIVGRNGAGKTTLFRLITGELAPTRGVVSRTGGLRVVLLDQHRAFGEAATVWEAAASGFREVMALERELAALAERMGTLGDEVTEDDMVRYGEVQDRFAHLGGYDYHARVDAVLQGLGFDPEEAKTRTLASLSGGERGLAGLAAPLAAPADLLLLDEPTNHLDLDTTRWLTAYLQSVGETVLVVSHDRAFLDETVDHVLHVHAGTVAAYRGGYSAFVRQREERLLADTRAYDKQRGAIAKEEEYIRRHIAGQNSAQAKGRRRRLDRLPRLSPPPGDAGAMAIRLEAADRGGDRVIQAEGLRVAVGDRILVEKTTLTVHRGDVIALIGSNGAGKSTLLATLLGVRTPAAGEARIGASITSGWYRQDLAGVPLDRTIFDVIQDLRPHWNRGQVQGHLGAFGFSGDEVRRNTTSLSGGERARVALAMITLQRANLLVLDEPTNHLDVESIEVLEDALEEYEGTVLLVSHDRAFLRELATRVWLLEEETVVDFAGTFVEWETARMARYGGRERTEDEEDRATRTQDRAAARRQRAVDRQRGEARRASKEAVMQAEARALALELEVADLEARLADPSLYDGSADRALEAGGLHREVRAKRKALDEALGEWARLEDGEEIEPL